MQVAIGFGISSHWLRKWRDSWQPITGRSKGKPKKTRMRSLFNLKLYYNDNETIEKLTIYGCSERETRLLNLGCVLQPAITRLYDNSLKVPADLTLGFPIPKIQQKFVKCLQGSTLTEIGFTASRVHAMNLTMLGLPTRQTKKRSFKSVELSRSQKKKSLPTIIANHFPVY